MESPNPLDLPARLEVLAQLRDGWLDGEGSVLPAAGLAWLSKAWVEQWLEALPRPHAYLTPEGFVQLEWSTTLASTWVEINTERQTGNLLVSRTADGEILDEALFDLSTAEGWRSIQSALRPRRELVDVFEDEVLRLVLAAPGQLQLRFMGIE